ncbi:DUF2487 family protein [Alkalicoccobacillus porphyridii]|uniref:DUF2487 family protein n=1 Tax=Alkalicoccobacillus porphyridii TaxID=2597270 RepID=A0A553ZZQ5_9BACI|nr:DUF2487 family protein [Alkalicoccobacillus porphyridii]TSB46927.1 DUF2487 family protein [Alkalicoccobacillus porphyridii]
MKWNTKDIKVYQQQKQYVDTVLIPLLPMSPGKELARSVTQSEYSMAISDELERMYQGRLIVSLPFTYQPVGSYESVLDQLNQWIHAWREDGIKHVVLVTSDSEWRSYETALSGTLIWLAAVSLSTMEPKERMNICSQIAQDLAPIFKKEWS